MVKVQDKLSSVGGRSFTKLIQFLHILDDVVSNEVGAVKYQVYLRTLFDKLHRNINEIMAKMVNLSEMVRKLSRVNLMLGMWTVVGRLMGT